MPALRPLHRDDPSPRTSTRVLSLGVLSVLTTSLLVGCGGGVQDGDDVVGGASSSASGIASGTGSAAEASPSGASASAAAYVAATPEHPAQNVPVPVLPEEATEETLEGAKAFISYWQDSMRYLIATGEDKYIEEVTDKNNEAYVRLFDRFSDIYREGNWVVDGYPEYRFRGDSTWGSLSQVYSGIVYQSREDGKIYSDTGLVDEIPGDSYNGQPQEIFLVFENNRWLFKDIGNISGVNYDE